MQRHHGVARGRSYTREQARAFGDVRDIGVPGLAQFILPDRVWIGFSTTMTILSEASIQVMRGGLRDFNGRCALR